MKIKNSKWLFILGILVTFFCFVLYKFFGDKVDELHQIGRIESSFERLPLLTTEEDWTIQDIHKKNIQFNLESRIDNEKIYFLSYRVQMISYVEDGDKLIWLNGFCNHFYDETESYWKKTYVGIMDLGKCGFEGIYDVNKKTIVELVWQST